MSAYRHGEHRSPAALVVALALVALPAIACDDATPRPSPTAAPDSTREAMPAHGTPDPRPEPRRTAWTLRGVLRRLDGRRIPVGERSVRLDRDTIACGGVSRAEPRAHAKPAWTRFRCVQPTFPPGSVAGPDAIFVVEPTGRRTFVVTGARFSRY